MRAIGSLGTSRACSMLARVARMSCKQASGITPLKVVSRKQEEAATELIQARGEISAIDRRPQPPIRTGSFDCLSAMSRLGWLAGMRISVEVAVLTFSSKEAAD